MSYTIKPNKTKTLVYTHKGKEYRVKGRGKGGFTTTFEKFVREQLGGVIPKGNEVKQLRTNFYKNNIFNAGTRRWNKLEPLAKNKNAIKLKGGKVFRNNPYRKFGNLKKTALLTKQNYSTKGDYVPKNLREFYDIVKHNLNKEGLKIPIEKQWISMRFQLLDENNIRYVPVYSYEAFKTSVDNIMNGQPSGYSTGSNGSDVSLLGAVPDLSFYQHLYFTKDDGGGFDNEGKEVKSELYIVKNYKSKNNNCLIACMVDKRKAMKEHQQIRGEFLDKFAISIGTPITISNIPNVEKYFQKNIDVVGDDSYDDCYYMSEKKYDESVLLLLKDGHYTRIKNRRLSKTQHNKKSNKKRVKKVGKKVLYLFYDLETIFDREDTNLLKPYSCAWFIHNPNEKFIYNEKHFKSCKFVKGNKCLDDLMECIMNPPDGYKYKIIGFNNSRFDNFFLASKATEYGELAKNGFFYVNNSIFNMFICGSDTFDLCRFVACSLKDACSNFQTNPSKMEGYSHLIPQEHFDNGGWNGLMKFIDNNYDYVEKYNKLDVLSLCDLTMKVSEAVKILLGGKILTDYMTIGQLAYKHFNDKVQFDIPRPKTYEDDKFIRSALTAGRTQAYYGKMKYEGGLRMVDAKSLYPFVMMEQSYPVGDYIETKSYVENKKGIYRCKIIHQFMEWKGDVYDTMIKHPELHKPYAPVVYPLRSPEPDVPLNWEYRGEQEVNLTNIDIACIRRNGGEVEVYEGIYWEEDTDDLFKSYLEPLMNEKNKQDKLKKKKDENYNVALRELCKLFSNCLSGKVIQKNYEDSFVRVSSIKERDDEFDKLKPKSVSCYRHGKITYMTGKLKEELIYKKSAKPSYLGVFIYSYAREYMYESILNKYVCLYEDTDSALLPIEEYNRFIIDNADNIENGKYGCFEEEVGDATKSIMLAPKSYCVINEKNEKMSKYKFKGVRKDDRYVCVNDLDYDYNLITPKEVEMIRNDKLFSKCNTYQMFEDLHNGNDIVVFQSVLVKSKGDIGVDTGFNIKQRFFVKLISS